MSHYPDIKRHTTFRDFTKDLVEFQSKPCVRGCGRLPEQPNWLTCRQCQMIDWTKDGKAQKIGKARLQRGIKTL